VLFEFGLLYLGFALIMILAAIWLGLWFAERLSRPVGRLASAAQRVGQGDLDVRVAEEQSDDEIAMLGQLFNQMTRQLKGQRDTLIEQNAATEARRRLFDSVLTSVTAGVIGLNAEGRIDFMNRSAIRLLGLVDQRDSGLSLQAAVPEFGALFERLTNHFNENVQEEIKLTRRGKQESLLVRMATRRNTRAASRGLRGGLRRRDRPGVGAAHGGLGRRGPAHRPRDQEPADADPAVGGADQRKFGKQLSEEDAASLAQMTEVVVRQTNDLRRIVDEFSKFARMPEPETRAEDAVQLVREAVTLQEAGQPGTAFTVSLPDEPDHGGARCHDDRAGADEPDEERRRSD
jgi:two-component system nitrogen regulation sensor histidine kinase NtrY